MITRILAKRPWIGGLAILALIIIAGFIPTTIHL